MKIFFSFEVLGVIEDQIFLKMGMFGILEFGMWFVCGMFEEIYLFMFNELFQILGFLYGIDVWLGNVEELIKDGMVMLVEVIGCCDNIMIDLIYYGMEFDMFF